MVNPLLERVRGGGCALKHGTCVGAGHCHDGFTIRAPEEGTACQYLQPKSWICYLSQRHVGVGERVG